MHSEACHILLTLPRTCIPDGLAPARCEHRQELDRPLVGLRGPRLLLCEQCLVRAGGRRGQHAPTPVHIQTLPRSTRQRNKYEAARSMWVQAAGLSALGRMLTDLHALVVQRPRHAGRKARLAGVNEVPSLFALSERGRHDRSRRQLQVVEQGVGVAVVQECAQVGAAVCAPQQQRAVAARPHHLCAQVHRHPESAGKAGSDLLAVSLWQ